MAVPLESRGTLLGALSFVTAASGHRYTKDDLELAEELGRRTSLAIENARLYQHAKEALHAREEFLAIAAHEIRTPLTSLHLGVQSLRQGLVRPAEMNKMLDRIEAEDRKLARLLGELLDLGRIRGGRLQLDLSEVDLVEVTRDVVSQLGNDLGRSGSTLSLTTEARIVGLWDRGRLEQVVTNLLANAVKFGLGRPIEVVVAAHGATALLTVRDHGIGIPRGMQQRIFRPFERAVSDRQYGGLGLGLYIVHTIVDALGGTIHLESKSGAGTTFRVELPCTREA